MSNMKPLIGINCNFTSGSANTAAMSVRANYVDAIAMAGGVPIVLPPTDDNDLIRRHVEMCDGFLVVGGADISPARFGDQPHPLAGSLNPRREEYDLTLIQAVIAARKPIMGICLGCQEINVVLGGTLIQDIASQTDTKVRHYYKQSPYLPTHKVRIEPETLLHRLTGCDTLDTNSSHHQAVRDLAPHTTKSAVCEADGIIECFEISDYPFGLAVQWHPEYLTNVPEHLRLFQGLVEEASK